MARQELDSKSATIAGAIVGITTGLLGIFFHGMLGMPSMMGYMYRSFMWLNPVHAGGLLIVFIIGGAFYGWLIATAYNYAAKNY